jgi:formylmethanofuran dehydrogenase subunit E
MIPKPGQIVHCIRCDEPMFQLNSNTQAGAMVQDCIDAIGDQKWPDVGELFECSKCHEPVDFHNIR